jgi:hypothetical protein
MITGPKAKLAALLVFAAAPALHAGTLFFSGDLRTNSIGCDATCQTDADYAQNAAVVDTFTVTDPSTMYAITFGYGGGVSGTGAVVAAGGFEPYLSLFDPTGHFLASTYDPSTTCPAGANTYNGNCFDVRLDGGVLQPGMYFIAITAYPNMSFAENYGDPSLTLADGFTQIANLGVGEDLHYGFDVVLTAAPEPGAGTLFAIGSALLLIAATPRKKLRREQ